jgi:hypothetical protein
MFFPVLEGLKDSEEFDEQEISSFDNLLRLIYSKKYHKRFSPRIYKYFGFELSEGDWIRFLEELSLKGYIKINFELCCPKTDESIITYERYDDMRFGSEKTCPNCGEVFIATEADIFITYQFNDALKPDLNSEDVEFFRKLSTPMCKKKDLSFSLDDYKLYPERVFGRILDDRKEELKEILAKSLTESNPQKKGSLYEELASKLFESPYLTVHKKGTTNRYSTGQIDLYFIVKRYEGTIFHEFSDLMIIECKNWDTKKVGVQEIRELAGKMNELGINVGMMFSKKGVTGDDDAELQKDGLGAIRRIWDSSKRIIIVITLKDIYDLLNGKNLYRLLEEKYYDAETI